MEFSICFIVFFLKASLTDRWADIYDSRVTIMPKNNQCKIELLEQPP